MDFGFCGHTPLYAQSRKIHLGKTVPGVHAGESMRSEEIGQMASCYSLVSNPKQVYKRKSGETLGGTQIQWTYSQESVFKISLLAKGGAVRKGGGPEKRMREQATIGPLV